MDDGGSKTTWEGLGTRGAMIGRHNFEGLGTGRLKFASLGNGGCEQKTR